MAVRDLRGMEDKPAGQRAPAGNRLGADRSWASSALSSAFQLP